MRPIFYVKTKRKAKSVHPVFPICRFCLVNDKRTAEGNRMLTHSLIHPLSESFVFFVAQNLPADDELKIVAGTTNSILGFLVTQLVDLSFVDTEESISHSQTGLLCQTVTVDLNRLK